MKKLVAFLLCFSMLFAFCSCECEISDFWELFEIQQTHQTESIPVHYDEMIGVYRDIIRVCQRYDGGKGEEHDYAAEFGIDERCDKELYEKLFVSAYMLYGGRGQNDCFSPHYKLSCGYAIKDINLDGMDELILLNADYTIVAILSIANGTPILLGNYQPRTTCYIDAQGLLHELGSNASDSHSHAVYRIAPGGAETELVVEFGTRGHIWVDDIAVQQYYKLEGELATEITEQEYRELSQCWNCCDGLTSAQENQCCAGLVFTPLFTEQEIAAEMYQAAFVGECAVYNTDSEQFALLGHYKTPYNGIPLYELHNPQYAYEDLDVDGICELVLAYTDITLILRYYQGTVYLYSFTFRNMYDLNADGTYAWNHTGEGLTYGQSRLHFDGTQLTHELLWKVVDDGEPHAAYYIGEREVTQAELEQYVANHPNTPIKFSPSPDSIGK